MAKKNPCPKNFRQKIFGSKRVRSRKVVVQKNVVQKIKVQKYFGSKKNLGPKLNNINDKGLVSFAYAQSFGSVVQ